MKGGRLVAPLLAVVLAGSAATLSADGQDPGAPGFSLPEWPGGSTVTSGQLRDHVVYLDFWASWCGPCRESLPIYEQMHREFEAQGVRFVAINLDEERADAERFLARNPVSYTVLLDPDGDTAAAWQIKAMPSSFLLDTDGSVVRSWAGFESDHAEDIRNAILELLR